MFTALETETDLLSFMRCVRHSRSGEYDNSSSTICVSLLYTRVRTITRKWRYAGLGSETKESDRSLRVALRLSQKFCKNFRLWIETVLENSAAMQVKNFELASDAKVKIRILVGSYVQWTASSCSHCEVHTCLLLD